MWKRPLEEIDVDWIYIPGRLPIPDWRTIVRAAVGILTEGYPEQARFYYPLRGGIMTLFRAVFERALNHGAKILLNTKINNIRIKNDYFIINNKIKAKNIVNTIPLPDLIKAFDNIDNELVKYASEFDFNSVVTIAIAINKRAPKQHWIYVPDEKIVFHRYVWMSNYSPYNAPPDKSLIVTEITLPPNSIHKLNTHELIEKTINDLESLNIIKRNDIIFSKIWIHKYGYPIHKIGFSAIRSRVLDILRTYGIVSVGRWGRWKYLNMDMVLKDVMMELPSIRLSRSR